ncbi:sensor histidine kinase [Furfurilactobacillus siliginis]|uniref:histidine kinase n=2 Tax=Furfurilactobacillus siliginis TaxID=348151 RepID=A0A510VRK6_9LACO|nr:sensor histidine kinase [Furfurilactobacillus siliginis]GEK29577.1 sensor protein LytS [Furfurilactobacillus siliginis]
MLTLFLLMMQRVGLIIILAFVLVNVSYFRRLVKEHDNWTATGILILIFAAFAVISNLTGVEITPHNNLISSTWLTGLPATDSIANTRTLAITVSGLVGGPVVGTAVGLVAGIHRVIQGNGSDLFYIASSVIVGLLSGMIGRKYLDKNQYPGMAIAALIGLGMEAVQMAFIFIFSTPGFELVQLIFFPMMILNSAGTAIFMSVISAYIHQEEQLRAVQTHDVLELADRTLPFFSSGLSETNAQQAAVIIREYTNFDAIGITDASDVLAHVGPGSDHHIPEKEVMTDLSKRVIATGQMRIAHSKAEIGCPHPGCPLAAAVVIPLIVQGHVVGTLKMYFTNPKDLTPVEEQLATGLASIFSSQLALGMAEEQSKLVKDAEIKSLQAQVNPHFFFNAINTISALMRTDADKARTLLLQLSTYFRTNLQGARETEISLQQEREHVNAYLSLEQTRFPDKYTVGFDVETSENVLLPPFTIQVLVENAMRHAFGNRRHDNHVWVLVSETKTHIQVAVKDDGLGIDEGVLPQLGKQVVASANGSGTALENLNARLTGLYGQESRLHFDTSAAGTTVSLLIPRKERVQNESLNR